MGWKSKPLGNTFGIEVAGADLRDGLDERGRAELRGLLDQHLVVLFRNQQLSDEEHINVLGSFGRVSDERGDGVRNSFVSNVREGGLFGDWPLPFHQDYGTFQATLASVISLYGYELRGPSMPTMFASLVHGYRRLPAALREQVARLTAVHSVDLTVDTGQVGFEKRVRLLELPEYPPESTHPRQTHPVVKSHSRTGAPMLFLSEMHTSHIEGLDSAHSEALVQRLFAHLYDPACLVTHDWAQGDLLIWDNVALQHGRRPVDRSAPVEQRTLRRIVICEKSTKEIFKNIRYNNSKGFTEAGSYS